MYDAVLRLGGKLYLSLGGKAEAGRPPVMFPFPISHYTIA